MKAIIKPTFEIDVTDWNKGEGLTEVQRIKQTKEDLEDFSVFMPHCDYQSLKDIKITFK